ncbi:type II toxin-antitoxin system HipA family toxin [Stenotrophomonas forensis]|jgi:serine/threonine-protein kinase HipA|uniref:HipA domain-containing protein n=1 Tax=Stenotrophomonas forensis TaxID=2871169 RepID=A0ABY7Y4J4_9GAMM|nr:HipA domain-containing protein [Stenotrophomonas sp. DFS-20110405]WDM64899.1 HipA domain-containing protein [Stenotrophomonas sp. DFS-20110405]
MKMKFDQLYLWCVVDPSQPRYVGELSLMNVGKGVSLRHGEEWRKSGFALSEDLPLERDMEFVPPTRLQGSARAVGAVDDARPDRWGEKVIRYVDKPDRHSLMEYLYLAGDDRFGALGVSTHPGEYLPHRQGPLPRLEDAQTLSEAAAKIENAESLSVVEQRIIAAGGSPLGGAKPKAVIQIGGAEWVIKFFNNEPVDAPLVEHASMTLASRAGITVAETKVIPLDGTNAVAIHRFDREMGKRIHSLSASTAIRAATTGVPDLGYPALALILRRKGVSRGNLHEADARELFRRMVFNILIDNTDDHEKNHSLLVPDPGLGQLRLAPAYDVLPTNSGQGMQEFRCGTSGHDSTLDNAMSECSAFGLTAEAAAAEVVKVIAVVDTWQEHFQQAGVSARDIEELARSVDRPHLLNQRRQFDPLVFTSKLKRKRKRSSFQDGVERT